ncbi:MAG: amino acid aminotransferase [Gammaproteobacteria bacterium]|nr:MAG: amino acid aminotransferase [Gammaproteobacteria bacterium]
MFEKLSALPSDPILGLTDLYRKDTRADKIDVGVGVFRNAKGETPIMRAVYEAEQYLHDKQTTKSYVSIAGDPVFDDAMIDLVFANSVDKSRVRAVQAPGGSGALRISADMLHNVMPEKTVWVSDPTWGNHVPIFKAAGFAVKTYPYLNPETKMVDEDKMLDALAKLGTDDIVLLHGCCHNPTGSDISPAAWDRLADIAVERGFLPFIDLAYQGFGDGLDADLYGTRKLASTVSDLVVTSSCSKNFGLYRDRVGCAMIIAKDTTAADITKGHLTISARVAYSMPPDHGAALVGIILTDANRRQQWENELAEMRNRILGLRSQLAETMQQVTGTNDWDFINRHRGMFSLLCLNKQQTDTLINEHSIYIVGGGRINIAGLKNDQQVMRFAQCLAAVTR